jgi:hypothetical protein
VFIKCTRSFISLQFKYFIRTLVYVEQELQGCKTQFSIDLQGSCSKTNIKYVLKAKYMLCHIVKYLIQLRKEIFKKLIIKIQVMV